MLQIEPLPDYLNEIRDVWLCCDGEVANRKEWFQIGTVKAQESRALSFENKIFMITNDDGYHDEDVPEMTDLLQWLITAVSERIQQMRDGIYDELMEQELPYRRRVAVIDRAALWKLYPEQLEKLCQGLSAEEQTRMLQYLDEDEIQPPKPLSSMTASEYYTCCFLCYRAMGLTINEDATPKDHYRRYADGRNGNLEDVPPDDANAFRKWANVHRGAHQWEFCFSGAYELWAEYNPKEGYTLLLSSCRVEPEIVRAYLALREQNLPVTFNDSKSFARKLRGLGKVVVAGARRGYDLNGEETRRHQMMAAQKGETFDLSRSEKEYDEIMPMWMIPDDERFKEFIKLAKWMPLPPQSQLVKEDIA